MGTLTFGVKGDSQKQQFREQNSCYFEKLNEDSLGKLKGSMNLDEFLKNAWTPEINHQTSSVEGRHNGSSNKSLQSQGSLPLSRTESEKMVDDVWREIQEGEKIRTSQGVKREPSMGEMTLEDFLAKAGAMDESTLGPVMPLDIAAPSQCFSPQMGLSPAPSIGALSDTPISGLKRDSSDMVDRSIEKRLKRKIKNRESAARSRARKQAYHNELVSKVSLLEEQNMRLKKEKELESHYSSELSEEPRYQLRRTSSAIF